MKKEFCRGPVDGFCPNGPYIYVVWILKSWTHIFDSIIVQYYIISYFIFSTIIQKNKMVDLSITFFDSDFMSFSFQSNITSGKYNVLSFFPKWWINICAFHAPKGTHWGSTLLYGQTLVYSSNQCIILYHLTPFKTFLLSCCWRIELKVYYVSMYLCT